MNKPQKPNWRDAKTHVAALTGDDTTPVTIQVFDDCHQDGRLAGWRHGRLTDPEMQKWIVARYKRGAGVFMTINETDGAGRRSNNITRYRAAFVDLDGAPLADVWPLKPSYVVESSAGKYHCYWLLQEGADWQAWLDLQARLAAYYKGDKAMADRARVLRLAGFDHQKAEPFRVRFLGKVDPAALQFDRYTLQEVADGHPCDYAPPASPSKPGDPGKEPAGGYDLPANVAKAENYIESLDPSDYDSFKDLELYTAACELKDIGISPERALELLHKLNTRASVAWDGNTLQEKVRNAYRYGQNDAGSKSVIDPRDEFEIETTDFVKKQTIPRLNDVNEYNIGKLFRLVNLNGKVRVAYWARSALDPKVCVPQFWSPQDFKTALRNKEVVRKVTSTDAKGKEHEKQIKRPLADYWLDHPNRYTYDGVVLRAEMDSASPDAINLWRGYGVEQNTTGDWSLLREHIRDVIANGKADRDEYIIRWIAWALQNADKPCEVALILKSTAHGTGKGMLLRTIRKLFGAHAMQISKGGLLTGRFNAHLAMTCFLFVDEMTLADNKESATLNSTLTEDAIPIEPKGVDAYMMPNHVKVAAASNQEHVILVAGSDRRFMVFDVSDKRARDSAYFRAMQTQLDNGGYGRMLHDLLEFDLGDWHPRDTAGVSDDKDPEKQQSAGPEVHWLAGYLDSGVLDCQVNGRGGSVVHASDLYLRARKANRGLMDWSDHKFAAFLKGWGCTRIRSNGSLWRFPSLADMRNSFRAKYPYWPSFDDTVDAWHDDYEVEEPDFG
jgi:hypothetical protein